MIATSDWVATGLSLGIPLLTGVVAWTANGVRADRTRRKKLYADAFSVLVSYKEFPYAIRRRRAPMAGSPEIGNEERLRLSDELFKVQEALGNYAAQIRTESTTVSAKYEVLVTRTREVAGSAMREAWKAPPLDNDAGMNLDTINYGELAVAETEYLDVAKADVHWKKRPWR